MPASFLASSRSAAERAGAPEAAFALLALSVLAVAFAVSGCHARASSARLEAERSAQNALSSETNEKNGPTPAAPSGDAPFVVVIDPGHGGLPLGPLSIHGERYCWSRREYLQAVNPGALHGDYRESAVVYGLAEGVQANLQAWRNRSLADIGRLCGIRFSDPDKRVRIQSSLSRPADLPSGQAAGDSDPNAPYRMFDYPAKGERRPGRLSRIVEEKPHLLVCLHMRKKRYAGDSGGVAVVVPPGSFMRLVLAEVDPLVPQSDISAHLRETLPAAYHPYFDWFNWGGRRTSTDWMFSDLALHLLGYETQRGTLRIDPKKYAGHRERMLTWPYAVASSRHPEDFEQVVWNSPFLRRELSLHEERRRHAGREGYGGDNLYASMELLKFIDLFARERLRYDGYRIGKPWISVWLSPLFTNAVTAFIEVGCLDSDIDRNFITSKSDVIAEAISVGILSLFYGTRTETRGNGAERAAEAPKGHPVDWKSYGGHFLYPRY
jgi:hypothetical protein